MTEKRQISFETVMKRMLLTAIGAVLLSAGGHAQTIEQFVSHQLQTYPKSRLTDLYKSSFQDYMGAEHLVTDRDQVKRYLDEELQTPLSALPSWYFEPCGVEGRFVRVSIRAVKEHVISAEELLDAFILSANKRRPSTDEWRERWHTMMATIDRMQLPLSEYDHDKRMIDSILSVGRYAISHSSAYREAYNPHYRIIERSIFEREFKEKLTKYQSMANIINENPTAKTYLDVVRDRYSCRSFDPKQVSKEQIDYILESGRLAPTAKNLQEQHIYVCQSAASLAKIDAATRSRYGAPTCLVVTWDTRNTYVYPGERYDSGAEDATIVATHIMLAAQAIGLGSCWVNNFDPDKLASSLGLPAHERILMILSLGIPAANAQPSPRHEDRKPIEETVTFL